MDQASNLNRAVRAYIALLGACAVAVAAFSVVADPGDNWIGRLPSAGLLAAGILAAQWFPIHLTDKTKVYVDTSILIAAVLLLPPGMAIVTVALASAIHELIARASWEQGLFNVAQSAVYIGAGAWTFRAITEGGARSDLVDARTLTAAGAGIVVMHLLNTAAVAGVAGGRQGAEQLAAVARPDALGEPLPERRAGGCGRRGVLPLGDALRGALSGPAGGA